MFRTIVVGVDGAAGGRDACALALALADPDARFIVAHVRGERRSAAAPATADRRPAPEVGDDDPALSGALSRLSTSTAAEVLLRTVDAPSVAAGLHQLADAELADLLVVGSHHHGRGAHLWSGDRTRPTLRDAPCAVAVAPIGYGDAPAEAIRTVGIGYDESPQAGLALHRAQAIALEGGAEVRALEVVPASNWRPGEDGVGWRAADAAARLAQLPGVHATVVEGHVHEQMAAFAREVDLLVLGSHHHGVLRRLVLGDTVEGLTTHLPCALLVLPHAVPAPPSRDD